MGEGITDRTYSHRPEVSPALSLIGLLILVILQDSLLGGASTSCAVYISCALKRETDPFFDAPAFSRLIVGFLLISK